MIKRIHNWLGRSLKRKIYLGFCVLSLLLLIIGTISLSGLLRVQHLFDRYNRMNDQANLLIGLDLSTKEVQRHVTRYMYEGYQSAGLGALEEMERMRHRLAETSTETDLEVLATLESVRSHLDVYQTTFMEVIQEKQIYNRLVNEDLPALANAIEDSIKAWRDELESPPGLHLELLYLANARASLLSYLENLDVTHARLASSHIATLRDHVHSSVTRVDPSVGIPEIEFIEERLREYERLSARVVQATRGILFLTNVVMAAEAAEIIHEADLLRRNGEQRKRLMQAEIMELSSSLTSLILWLTLITVTIGLAYTVFMARQITLPLSRITETFRDLSRGDRVLHIPGSERSDEIGALAHSANVFRERNAETEKLLQQADSLTRELKEKTTALQESNLELEQFVYTVSHDLKSPIVTSMGFIGIIRELAGEGRYREAIDKLDRVEKANARMGTLINDLLELSRVGRQEAETEVVDTAELLDQLAESCRPLLDAEGFTLDLMGPFPPIRAHPSRILQIFENLLTNAIKYGNGQPPHGNRIEISCASDPANGRNVFRVRDFGRGIPPEFHERVFALFARLDPSTPGTGIGLAIVRKLVRVSRGEVWIEEPDGPGSVFCVAFPVCPQLP